MAVYVCYLCVGDVRCFVWWAFDMLWFDWFWLLHGWLLVLVVAGVCLVD